MVIGVWVTEQVVGSAPNLDPNVMLALGAAYTDRMRLGCAVYVSTLGSPLHLAKTIATLDQVSGGRLDVGLGAGGGFRAFGAFGMDREAFVGRFTEGLRLMQAAWTQERFDVDGRFWRAQGLAMEPKPLQKPCPPIWLGGSHPDALRRAVRLGDGFIGAGSTMTEDYIQQARIVHEQVERAGPRARRRSGWPSGSTRHRRRPGRGAVARLTEALEGLYGYFGTTGVGRVGVSGRAYDVAEVLQRILDAGPTCSCCTRSTTTPSRWSASRADAACRCSIG